MHLAGADGQKPDLGDDFSILNGDSYLAIN